jgi:hypothetical protein
MTLISDTLRRNGGAHVVGIMCNQISHYALVRHVRTRSGVVWNRVCPDALTGFRR